MPLREDKRKSLEIEKQHIFIDPHIINDHKECEKVFSILKITPKQFNSICQHFMHTRKRECQFLKQQMDFFHQETDLAIKKAEKHGVKYSREDVFMKVLQANAKSYRLDYIFEYVLQWFFNKIIKSVNDHKWIEAEKYCNQLGTFENALNDWMRRRDNYKLRDFCLSFLKE